MSINHNFNNGSVLREISNGHNQSKIKISNNNLKENIDIFSEIDFANTIPAPQTGVKRNIKYLNPESKIDLLPAFKKLKRENSESQFLTQSENSLAANSNLFEQEGIKSSDLSTNEKFLYAAWLAIDNDYDFEEANQQIESYITNGGGLNFLAEMINILSLSGNSYYSHFLEDRMPFQSLKAFCLFH